MHTRTIIFKDSKPHETKLVHSTLLISPATPGFRTIEPERFWIDMGCFGMIKKRETFVPETIEKQLGNDQSWSDMVRLRKKCTHYQS